MKYWKVVENKAVGGDIFVNHEHKFKNENNAQKFYNDWHNKNKKSAYHYLDLPVETEVNFDELSTFFSVKENIIEKKRSNLCQNML